MNASTGAPLDDEIGHFLLAHDVWSRPALVLSQWGRTLNTLIYALPAAFGLEATRWFSLALTTLAMTLTWQLGHELNLRHLFLLPLFFWFQPWMIELSWTCLTEVPFLLFIVAGLLALCRKRAALAGVLLGSLPLIRHEGLGIVAAGVIYAACTRNGRLLSALVFPYVVYGVIYRLTLGVSPLHLFANAKPTDAYGSGGWFHFARPLLASSGPVLALALFGLPRFLRTNRSMLVGSVYALYLLMHVVIYRFGLFASGGYVEFLLPLAPIIALAAVAGIDLLVDEVTAWDLRLREGNLASLPLALVLGGVAIALAGYSARQVHPHAIDSVQAASVEAAGWIRANGLQSRRIEASNVWFFYAMPIPMPEPVSLAVTFSRLADLPPATLVVWDEKYSNGWGRPLAEMADKPQEWRRLQAFGPHQEVVLFEKL